MEVGEVLESTSSRVENFGASSNVQKKVEVMGYSTYPNLKSDDKPFLSLQ